MIKNKRARRTFTKKYAVVVDGDCESWYFQMLKRHERQIPADLRPEIPQNKTVDEQYKLVVNLAKDYDKVIWVIDYDVVLAESRLVKKGSETPIAKFQKYCAKLKEHKKIHILVNNPCLEFWFLLHFQFTAGPFQNCNDAENRLKKYIPDFEKTERYFTKDGHDIYLQLQPKLQDAIINTRKLGQYNSANPDASLAEIYKLFELLGLANRQGDEKYPWEE